MLIYEYLSLEFTRIAHQKILDNQLAKLINYSANFISTLIYMSLVGMNGSMKYEIILSMETIHRITDATNVPLIKFTNLTDR